MFSSHPLRARECCLIFRFFILKEVRKYPFFFLLLIFTLLLGTLGLTGINVVSRQVQEKLKDNAKELLTSDLSLSARRSLKVFEKEALDEVMSKRPHDHYEVIDVYSMVSHTRSGESRLVEIRGFEGNFPFYGEITTLTGKFSEDLYISSDLGKLWGIEAGDEIVIGKLKVNVKGIVTEDSSLGIRGFSLAPRVYLPLKFLFETKLLNEGSTGNFAHHYKIKDANPFLTSEIKDELYKKIADGAVKVILPEDSSEQSGRVINVITNFMALSALIGLILSLVGVFYLYQSHLVARLRDFALLNLYGLSRVKILTGVMVQFSVVFLFVFLLQLFIVVPGYKLLAPSLSLSTGIDLPLNPNLSSLLRLFPFLYLLALSILVPLLMGLMRTSMGSTLKASKLSMGRFRFYDFIPFLVSLWFLSSRLSENYRTGSIFFACLMLIFLLSTLLIKIIQFFLRRYIQSKGLRLPNVESGIAMRGLVRSGHKLTLSFLSLAMGATLISLILQLDHKIQGELEVSDDKPGLFIFDIQDEQMEDFEKFSKDFGTPIEAVTPLVRARLESVNGVLFEKKKNPFAIRDRESDDFRQTNNALNITYRGFLTPAENIIEGSHFPPEGSNGEGVAKVSLEKRWAQRMDLSLGDKLTFDVQGVSFDGVVYNIKEVKWTSFYPNFFVTLEPGFLEGAPKTYLAVYPSGQADKKSLFQRQAVEKFPNVSFINVEEIVGKLAALFEKSRQAIEIISWLSLGVGLVILYGLSHDQVYRRHYDLALMKSLGFSEKELRMSLIYEFGFLFLISMTLGFSLGWAMANIIGKEIFKLPWSIDWVRVIVPVICLIILCLTTILVSSWRAVRSKPRELLSDS